MQHYRNDPYEREHLDAHRYDSHSNYPSPPPRSYSPLQSQSPYSDAPPPAPAHRTFHPSAHPDSAWNRMQGQDSNSQHSNSLHSNSAGYESAQQYSPNPQYVDNNAYYNNNNNNNNRGGGGGGGGYPGGMDAMHSAGQVPPPPSRSQYPPQPVNNYSPQSNDYAYEDGYNHNSRMGESHSSLTGLGAAGMSPGSGSPAHRGNNIPPNGPYQGYNTPNTNSHLGLVNPNDIEDDGDDGLVYHSRNQRNSMLSFHSDRGRRAAAGTAAAGAGGAAVGAALLSQGRSGGGGGDYEQAQTSKSEWLEKNQSSSKKWKWTIIIVVVLLIIGGIVGGVLGSMLGKKNKDGSSSGSGSSDSASDDQQKNGDLGINSDEIKKLLNNADLHRVFPGMDYTPLNTQYPDCLHNPPSQNNVTRDVAVLSQLTNKIRLYGTDCNQTQMLLHAIDRLELKDTKVWLGVWQDGNQTTNTRQLDQMWDILEEYGQDPFEGIIVANEILFREEMTETVLGSLLAEVRTNLTAKNMDLPVATSDLGDDWTSALAADSDYIMANIHPFFSGVTADKAAEWTYAFWENNNQQFWKSDKEKNIISETGWPTAGGKSCGGATTCTEGSVAGIDELNTFMEDWVCQALKNGTNYFWFEAFDEPWKIRFNTKGKEWEDKWGLLTVDRELKDGVKIPDCGGQTV